MDFPMQARAGTVLPLFANPSLGRIGTAGRVAANGRLSTDYCQTRLSQPTEESSKQSGIPLALRGMAVAQSPHERTPIVVSLDDALVLGASRRRHMTDNYLFKLLEFRSLILLAVLVAGVAAIHFGGPFELQTPVDRVIVTPIVRSTTALAGVLHIGTRHAEPVK